VRRLPHGATKRPPVVRPGSGYGRPVRPVPPDELRAALALTLTSRDESELVALLLPVERDAQV
jgi:hypothetical protein